jgi:hypothetical protein
MKLVPISLADAKRYVNEHHNHSEAPVSWKFGVGLELDGKLIGVAIAGRPVSRMLDRESSAIEITRVCLAEKGAHRNAASRLYGAICRAAAALGYEAAYTYTLQGEDASSVRAAGFTADRQVPGQPTWSRKGRARQDATLFGGARRPVGDKTRWVRSL